MFTKARILAAGMAAFTALSAQADTCRDGSWVSPCSAQSTSTSLYQPHIDFRYKLGNERTLGSTEIFLPLRQSDHHLLFADVRGVVDTEGGSEGNLGLGFREMVLNDGEAAGIAGTYLFVDRRRTTNDNFFSQATLGAEWLSDTWDFRTNVYIPISRSKRVGLAPSGLTLAGNGLYVTSGEIKEKALRGYDVEVGHRLFGDSRIYVGGYQFVGGDVENVKGVRGRLEWDVNDYIKLGLESQHDHVRGNNSYAEFRLSIPFGEEPREELKGLYKRMTSPVVRDIDIVTNNQAAQVRTFAVNNAQTGDVQEIWYVDNSGANGTGTIESPFNNLADAEAAAGAGDIVYVAVGDGTSSNMAAGVSLNAAGQKLIGSGVDFSIDSSFFEISSDTLPLSASSALAIPATTAPLIENMGGNVVDISADNIEVAGVTVGTSGLRGVNIADVTNVTLRDMTVTNSAGQGVYASYAVAGDYTLDLDDITLTNNTTAGVYINNTGATNVTLTADKITSSGNGGLAQIRGAAGSTVAQMNNFSDVGSTGDGIDVDALTGGTVSVNLTGGVVSGTISDGVDLVADAAAGTSLTVVMNDVLIKNTGANGIVSSGWDTSYATVAATSVTIDNASFAGVNVDTINGFNMVSSTVINSAMQGIVIGDVVDVDLNGLTLADNAMQAAKATYGTAGSYTIDMNDVTASNSGLASLAITTNTAVGDANVTFVGDNLTDSGSGRLIRFKSTLGDTIDAQLSNFSSTNSTSNGLDAIATTGGQVALNLSNGVVSNTTTNGIEFISNGVGSSLTVVTDDVLIANAGENGFMVDVINSGYSNIAATSITVDNSTLNGFDVSTTTAGSFEGMFDTVTATNNSGSGFDYLADSAASTSLTVTASTFDNNTLDGFTAAVSGTGVVNTINLVDSFMRSNTLAGANFDTGGAATAQMVVQRNIFNQSGSENVYIRNNGTSTLDMLFTDNDIQNGATFGVAIVNDATGGDLIVKAERNTVANNAHGIVTFENSTANMNNVDLGGGSQGSVGLNRIYGNTGIIFLHSISNGNNISAQSNWWGLPTGPAVIFNAAGTLDTTNYLTSDPNP